ncbi:MAG: glutathione S-transferase family protein [Gammaproteobacteria bacterium]|nr:glutathione S-transferase family protein [Gammaproteobacteria bacterium]
MPRIETPKSPIVSQLQGLHLFHFDGAPCAQRVRFALGEKGLARGREEKFDSVAPSAVTAEPGRWVSRIVSLVRKDHMTEAYAEIHPNMVVPALVHDGTLYLESLDIIEYLDEAFGGTPLIPKAPELRTATMERVEQAKELHRSIRFVTFHWGLGRLAMLNSKERSQLATLAQQGSDGESLVTFYEGYSNGTIPDSIYRDHLAKLYAAFCELNTELKDGRQFLMSDELSIADAFWSMKILRLLECGYPVQTHHPEVFAWYQRIYQRPSFQNEVMGKNRLTNRVFRSKASIENLFGKGLKQAVNALAA